MGMPDPSSNGQVVPDDPGGAALLLTVEEAAKRLRIGRTTMYTLVSSGDVESVTIGRRRLVPLECVTAYVSALRSNNDQAANAAA